MLEINFTLEEDWKGMEGEENNEKEEENDVIRLSNGIALKWIQVNRLEVKDIEQLHDECLPVKYDHTFYNSVLKGNVKSLSLVDASNGKLVGMITSQTRLSSQSEDTSGVSVNNWIEDNVLTYILTLCVSNDYRRLGIASILLRRLIDNCTKGEQGYTLVQSECSRHLSEYFNAIPPYSEFSRDFQFSQIQQTLPSVSTCRCRKSSAVYLHVLNTNTPAIQFYEGHRFTKMRTLKNYYSIFSKLHHAHVYAIFINGGKPPTQILRKFSYVMEITENIINQTFNLIKSFFVFDFGREEEPNSQIILA